MRRAALLVLLAAAAACGHEGPVSGELSVRLDSPRNTDRAVLLRVVGPQHGVSAAAGLNYKAFADTSAAGDTTWITVVTAAGAGLASGEVARLAVNDVRKAGSYRATILQLAGASYALEDTTGVTIAVVRP